MTRHEGGLFGQLIDAIASRTYRPKPASEHVALQGEDDDDESDGGLLVTP